MENNQRLLTDIINGEARDFALYTVENRAIPNLMDGLKPVQRFVLHRAIQLCKSKPDDYHKLAGVAGAAASLGYHHSEVSAQDAGALMANTWNNNCPILDGKGNFGSRLVQKAAASRYIECRVHDNFRKYFKDTEVAPAHKDDDHIPPAYYLPIIPMVLINGVQGIGTGFATNILPHSEASIIECTKLALQGKLDKEPQVQFPQFKGTVVCNDENKYSLFGSYKLIGKTQIEITEIPYKYDRADYVENCLDILESDGLIVSYDDNCGKHGFGFKVKLAKAFNLPEDEAKRHAYIVDKFKLKQDITQFIYTIDEVGALRGFPNASSLIHHFVEVRKQFVQARIDKKTEEARCNLQLAIAKAFFIRKVLDGTIVIKGKKRQELKDEIVALGEPFASNVDALLSLNVYHMAEDEAVKLLERAQEAKSELEYWTSTDAVTEYMKDLG